MTRLDKYLADAGCGTRSELKKAVRKGAVKVDGVIIKDPGFQLAGNETVTFSGKPVSFEKTVYYLMNKPAGVVSATRDTKEKTVIDLLGEKSRPDLFPAGRLDKDTEGLLLITNDGELAHRLLSPRHHVDKTYYVKVQGLLTEEDCRAFAEGLKVSDDFTAMPAELVILQAGEISEAEVTIREGKFHQVKRMFHAVGKEVLYLKRLSMGTLKLDESLNPGEFRPLTKEELEALKGGE
ncbi:MAG: rRNA pseudouridine synthase [Eubacterium sp.]|nr:rRNA pseudouridine synthase [Eubacterium sp.]